MMIHFIISPLLLLYFAPGTVGTLFDLSNLQWTLKNQNQSIQIPAKGPPSQAHLDLLDAGIITEPLLGINDFTERWVINDNWTYTADLTPFTRELNSAPSSTILLVFYGIDTIANISVSGYPVAWVNNQFRQYIFDISDFLASPRNDNNLTVSFESAWHYGLNVTGRPDTEYFPGLNYFEYPYVYPWIRKVTSDFGWDWGPAFVPSGIHKRAYLVTLSKSTTSLIESVVESDINEPSFQIYEAEQPFSLSHSLRKGVNSQIPLIDSSNVKAGTLNSIFIEETSIDIYKVGQSSATPASQTADWIVNVTIGLRSAASIPISILTLTLPELNLISEPMIISQIPLSTEKPVWINVTWRVPDTIPQRWYPHDLGTPKLYDLTVSLDLPASKHSGVLPPLFNFTTKTGFRTIRLIQSPYSQEDVLQRGITPGDQWHFEINGKAFYSKGTNIIPFDPFYARISTEKTRWILESAVKSGQNMLRVWGGGAYQPSESSVAGGGYDFYSICDELGILAWSELIFSDAMYPVNDFFLESIEPEVRQNVRRINRHPSNAQWAGGNEIEGIVTWANRSLENGTHYLNEFATLFQGFLHDIVVSETRSVPYTACSTTGGVLSLDPYILRFNNGTPGEMYGNGERFNYDPHAALDYNTYPRTRFVNEFGFHSMPSFYSWEEVLTSPDDFSFNSTVVMSRDHHPPAGDLTFPNPHAPEGQAQMTAAVELWLPTPSTTDSNHTFAQWCWSTQIFQTMTIVSQVAWYRRGAGQSENNMGALVWQLNDIWQGVSWSSIEYSGRWKVLQYGFVTIFAPVTIYPFWTAEDQTLQVSIISDRWEEVSGYAQLTWYDWHGTPLSTTTHAFAVPSMNGSMVFESTGLDSILSLGKKPSDAWLLLNLTAEVGNETVTNEQYFTPTSLAKANLVDPKIRVTRTSDLTFTLSARGGVAPWTWIDHPAGTIGLFVDDRTGVPSNGFYLVPGIPRTLRFVLNTALSAIGSPDPADFVVRSLWNNTHV